MADPNKGIIYNYAGIPGVLTGQVFYVNNSGFGPDGATIGSDSHDGLSPLTPLGTLAGAIDKCTDYAGDTIILMPGHSETVTAAGGALEIDVIGVNIIGVGNGSLKPRFSINGAIDMIDITAADVTLSGIECRIITTDAATAFINVDAAGCTLKNISGIGSDTAINVVDLITVTANADDLLIDGVKFWNAIVAVNSFLSFEGAASRVTIKNFEAFGDVATGGIIDAAAIDYLWMENVKVGVVGLTMPAITLNSNPEGYAVNCFFAGTHGTLATNANMGNLMRLFNIWVTEETDGSRQGAQIPAVDTD